ncbi:AAA family ATPase [Chryseolinea sp. T2]|uniref:AAA family ATPase n=1 Tax=Chryseolinea sp. T2 TaxID=3129255 RepID=UPI0030773839
MNWSIANNKDWSALEKRFSWVADMHGVPQDAIHHAEGDVAIHTRMVLEALTSLDGYQRLDNGQREVLWTSALLHDVEKRSTTLLETDGRITSRGHAKRGEYTSRTILYEEVPAPFSIREQVCALVRYHGLPLWIFDKPDPAKAAIQASLRVDLSLLTTLARADVLGRICADQQELLYRINLFEELCRENNCWRTPRHFETDLSRFLYFNRGDSSPDYVPFDDWRSTVVMMCGLPGMGKDSYLSRYHSSTPVVSLDDIRRKHKLKPDDTSATGWVVQEAKEEAKSYLRRGEPFAWNATNITRQMRSQWIDLFATYKARVHLVYVEAPYQTWIKQNRERDHAVPAAVMQRLLSKLEVPSSDEAHRLEYVVSE